MQKVGPSVVLKEPSDSLVKSETNKHTLFTRHASIAVFDMLHHDALITSSIVRRLKMWH
jgi:hypothetical protein